MEQQLKAKYTQQGLVHALNIFRFPSDYSKRNLSLAIRYLYKYRYKDTRRCPPKSFITRKTIELFEKNIRNRNKNFIYELADIVHTYCPKEGLKLLNRLRLIEEEFQERIYRLEHKCNNFNTPQRRLVKKEKKTVYGDSQNVHNTKINKSVLKATKTIFSLYKHYIKSDYNGQILNYIKQSLLLQYPYDIETIESSIKYITTSVATFGIDITLEDTLKAIWLYIMDSKHFSELTKRLYQEIKEMNGYCSTGHLARLLNVIQGYTTNDDLIIKISSESQCKAVVFHFISKKLQQCTDEKVLDGLVEVNDSYIDYIKTIVKEKHNDWNKEYGSEFIEKIPDVVNKYIGI